MSLYPTLEDMGVANIAKAQAAAQHHHQAATHGLPNAPLDHDSAAAVNVAASGGLYPVLDDYMGMALQPYVQQGYQMQPADASANRNLAVRQTAGGQLQVAPVTGQDIGLQRAEIQQGIRQVIVCKDQEGKVGLRVRHVNKGVFIAFVHAGSPAAMAGLRFGDQILQIDGQTVAGFDTDKVHKVLKNANPARIVMAIRDRPFERTITLHKDSSGHIGFTFKNGAINAIVKDSSAARNGVLTDHKLIEIGGQNVVGLKDSEIGDIIRNTCSPITLTIMPTFVYEHIVKCMGSSLLKKKMDHSIPDV